MPFRPASLLLVVAVLCVGGGLARAAETASEPLVPTEHGAIFPAARAAREAVVPALGEKEIESYWTPTREAVAELESRLGAFLARRLETDKADLAKVPWFERSRSPLAQDQRHVAHILEHLPETRRQYLGVVVGGAPRIVVNCFPREGFPDSDRQWIFVLDGGDWFWGVQYDVAAKTFLQLRFNGEG